MTSRHGVFDPDATLREPHLALLTPTGFEPSDEKYNEGVVVLEGETEMLSWWTQKGGSQCSVREFACKVRQNHVRLLLVGLRRSSCSHFRTDLAPSCLRLCAGLLAARFAYHLCSGVHAKHAVSARTFCVVWHFVHGIMYGDCRDLTMRGEWLHSLMPGCEASSPTRPLIVC